MVNKTTLGKAASLAYLKSLGLNVPDWHVISHETIISWGNKNIWINLEQTIKSGGDITEAAKKFANTIKIPDEILAKFKSLWVAVRSSASVEDSAENSFAGIFETKLFVKDNLEKSIIEVWASLFSEKSVAYCSDRRIPLTQLSMNIIIQEMVHGQKSGILFQADPLGRLDHLIIVAGYGIGQGVVDEITETDQYIFSQGKHIDSNITEKSQYLTYNYQSKKIDTVEVDKNISKESVLSKKELSNLIAISEVINKDSALFLDIEFTIKDDIIFVLQARPITTLPPKINTIVFDNSNIAENYPGQTLPFTFSSLQRAYSSNFRNLIRFIGFPKKDRDKIDQNLNQMIGYWGGQIYYNLNNWYSIYNLLPTGEKKAAQAFNEMVGINSKSISSLERKKILHKLYIAFRITPVFIFYTFLTTFYHLQYKKQFSDLYSSLKLKIHENTSLFELINILSEMDAKYLSIIKIPLFNDFFSSVLHSISRKMLSRISKNRGDSILNDLLSNRENLESSKAIYSLLELASYVQKDSMLKEFITMNLDNISFTQTLSSMSEFEEFDIRFRYHLDRYGDRSQWEMKFETPTARENLKPLLKLILDYADNNLSTDQHRETERRRSQNARAELAVFLRSKKITHFMFNLIFQKNIQSTCFREDARFDRVRMKGLGRTLLLKIGSELVRKGRIKLAEDVFYLYYEEVLALTQDPFGDSYLIELIELRKKHLEKGESIKLSDRIIVNDLRPYSLFKVREKKNEDAIKGVPCSSGQVTGEAVVVTSLYEAPSLTGKILIAERTDPSWGYFFVGVKGIIVEKGSMLSHAAIISRELGIPCIINVQDATSKIKNGATITMNGDTGEITVV